MQLRIYREVLHREKEVVMRVTTDGKVIQASGVIQPCCQNQENMVAQKIPAGSPKGIYHNKCKVCGRSHRGIKAEPGMIKGILKPLG